MTRAMGRIGSFLSAAIEMAKVRKGLLLALTILFVLQAYFVRELLAAELLFGLGFAVLLALGALAYFIGAIGERGLDVAENGVRVAADSARRGYAALEELSRKPFRAPRSESAQ